MTIQDAINSVKSALQNARGNNAQSQKIAQAKRTLLQRMEMTQLIQIYDKYCYIPPVQDGNIMSAFQAQGKPVTRQQYIEKIAQNMSWDVLRQWASDHHVECDDLD